MEEIKEDIEENGCFETDIPEKVVGAKMSSGMIQVTIEWKARSNGYKPMETIFSNEEVK